MNDCNEIIKIKSVARRWPTAGALLAIVQLGIGHQAIAAPLPGEVSGSAASLGLFVGDSTVASPTLRSASVFCPCNGTSGVTKTDTVSSVTLGVSGALVSASNTTVTALGTNTNSMAVSSEGAGVTKLSLLGGMITADAITAKASVGATSSALTESDDGTTIDNLVIAGTSIDPAVAENTSIALPGLGSVTIKAVSISENGQNASIVVHGLLVKVSAENSFGLALGSRITVATAKAGYSRAEPAAYLAGSGVGAEVTGYAGSVLEESIGLGGGISLPGCIGTGGVTLVSQTSKFSIPGLASAASEQATAFGGLVGAAMVTKTTATISDISLLNGLITATTLSAVAQVSKTGNISTASASGSELTGLMVGGVAVSSSSPANLKLTLPGIGYVVVNEQTSSGPSHNRIEVIGLDVAVTQTNLFGIPVGTRLVLGRAVAVARRF